jgi:16S rRNA (guanine527-N7)-methyltransferase
MHLDRIAELLGPFLTAALSGAQLSQLAAYLEILHRWNARMNLTAVRDPESVVTRHFGESLFAAQNLFPMSHDPSAMSLLDIGSGAGFPGLPTKIWRPELTVTLIESHSKKAIFLKEVIRALDLKNIAVSTTRAEDFVLPSAIDHRPSTTVTLRAVEKFDRILPIAARLATPGRLGLLIGSAQVDTTRQLSGFTWSDPLPIPLSAARVFLIGESR